MPNCSNAAAFRNAASISNRLNLPASGKGRGRSAGVMAGAVSASMPSTRIGNARLVPVFRSEALPATGCDAAAMRCLGPSA